MSKVLYDEKYRGYSITIDGKYKSNDYCWEHGDTESVMLSYSVFDTMGMPVYIERFQWEMVYKQKPKRFLFWIIKPKLTFEEQVKEELDYAIQYIHNTIDRKIHDQEITDGLIESLRK